jgi:hypothetical protein
VPGGGGGTYAGGGVGGDDIPRMHSKPLTPETQKFGDMQAAWHAARFEKYGLLPPPDAVTSACSLNWSSPFGTSPPHPAAKIPTTSRQPTNLLFPMMLLLR